MNNSFVFVLSLVLACFVASAVSQSSITVAEAQRQVLIDIAAEWPYLTTLQTNPWTSNNIDNVCNGALSFASACNATGWVTELNFDTTMTQTPVSIPLSLSKMSALETLTIGAFFGGSLDVDLGQLKSLKKLVIQDALFSERFPDSWSGMTALDHFEWSNALAQDSQPFPAFLAQMTNLTIIRLFSVNVTGLVPPFVAELASLRTLYMFGIPRLYGPLPEALTQSKTLRNLQLIGIRAFNELSEVTIPSDWSKATELRSLQFSSTPISGSLPSKLPSKFSQIVIYDTRINGTIPSTLINHPSLTTLSIDITPISGTIPAPSDLENSSLNFYKVTGSQATAIDANILAIQFLLHADFSANKISGLLPTRVGFNGQTTPSMLNFLSFAMNAFVGDLPSAYFENTPSLQRFYVNSNNLSGLLPDSIADSKKLVDLHLSSNSFSGQIPGGAKWSEFTSLVNIWMSQNYFSGSIPSGLFMRGTPKFGTFDFSSNRLDLCMLPENYTVSSQLATNCYAHDQTPQECGCNAQWPAGTCQLSMLETCPPSAPLVPIPIAPFSPTSPSSSSSPSRASPTSHGNKISANSMATAFALALVSFVAFFWA